MKKLYTREDIENLLETMPQRFCVRYALLVCNDIRHLITHKDAINALQVTQDWLDDKATYEQVQEAADAANASSSYTAYYAYSAAYSAAYHAAGTSAYYAYATANNAASNNKDYDIKIDEYYKLCISMMSPLERELFLTDETKEN